MKLIVGLGNPGLKYENTRHNIGFDIIDSLSKKFNIDKFKEKFSGLIAEGIINNEKVLILKPQTYMNLSGNSIIQVINFYKINPEKDMLIVYDDMDLPLGKIRIKEKGSAGGHNGIKSVISHVGDKFIRIKCGIGKALTKNENIDFVLGKFTKEEQKYVEKMTEETINSIDDICNNTNIERIMQKYNKK
jgi:PTH1 family peptidyl-tRNA hydrolase